MSKQLTPPDFFFNNQIKFQVYGVKIGIRAEKKNYLKDIFCRLKKVFPNGFEAVGEEKIEYEFYIKSKKNRGYELYRNDEKVIEEADRKNFFGSVESRIRLTIAEFAVGKVFMHAGVVGWRGRAIIIPAASFSGKSSLVCELVKKGALYYSDEYAVLDADGNVEPFPKWLSLRGIIDPFTQVDCSVESIGGTAGRETIPVGMILIARYEKNERNKQNTSQWQPEILSRGQGIMEMLAHTLPIRNEPEFVLEVLNKLTERAIIVKSVRGEAVKFAEMLLNYFDSQGI